MAFCQTSGWILIKRKDQRRTIKLSVSNLPKKIIKNYIKSIALYNPSSLSIIYSNIETFILSYKLNENLPNGICMSSRKMQETCQRERGKSAILKRNTTIY